MTSPEAEKQTGVDFAELYAGSQLAAAADAMVDKHRCGGVIWRWRGSVAGRRWGGWAGEWLRQSRRWGRQVERYAPRSPAAVSAV